MVLRPPSRRSAAVSSYAGNLNRPIRLCCEAGRGRRFRQALSCRRHVISRPPSAPERGGQLQRRKFGEKPIRLGGPSVQSRMPTNLPFELPYIPEPRRKPWNILLLVIDDLRADHLRWHGYERDTM